MHEGSWLRRVFRGSLTEKMIFILLLYFKKLKGQRNTGRATPEHYTLRLHTEHFSHTVKEAACPRKSLCVVCLACSISHFHGVPFLLEQKHTGTLVFQTWKFDRYFSQKNEPSKPVISSKMCIWFQ